MDVYYILYNFLKLYYNPTSFIYDRLLTYDNFKRVISITKSFHRYYNKDRLVIKDDYF